MLTRVGEPIYVESRIACEVDEIWRFTQDPAIHQRWDLRFTRIEYAPRSGSEQPQRFSYARRIAPGLWIHGFGETTGERRADDGSAASALRFWSEQARSLIRQGSGYWRYVPDGDGGVRFLTRYDYEPRWGALGSAIDRLIFRRAIGWATAWSFDAVRIWIERGIVPSGPLRALAQRLTGTVDRSRLPSASRCLRAPLSEPS